MLSLYGHALAADDTHHLVESLLVDGAAASLEAAAAIRWGADMGLAVDELEPDLCAAIVSVLGDPPPGLARLRDTLEREARPAPHRRLTRRLHNPRARRCECLGDCWCKRTAWGRMLRWYVPARHHSSVSPCFTQAHDRAR